MSPQRKALLFLMIPVLCWGMAYPAYVLGITDMGNALQWKHGPITSGLLFNVLQSGAALALWALFFPANFLKLKWAVLWRGLLLGFLLAAGYASNAIAYSVGTQGGVVAFFNALYVIMIPLILFAVARYRPVPSFFVGAVIVIGGVYVMTNPFTGAFGWGQTLGVLCAFAFAVQIILVDRFSRVTELGPLMMAKMIGYFATFFLAMAACWPAYGEGLTFDAFAASLGGKNVVWGFLYAGIFATVVAQFFQLKYQKDIDPTHAAVLFNLTPALALAAMALFGGEGLLVDAKEGVAGEYSKLIGAGMILAGNLVCELGRVWSARRSSAS